MIGTILLDCLFGYLLGSIPFGVIVTRAKGVDIFSFGSGNPGATNVSRAVGKPLGAMVFVLDVLKGVAPALLARSNIQQDMYGVHAQAWWFLAGLSAVLGHCYSPFLRFRGGKGIATSLGAGLGASPVVAGSAFGIFFALFAVTRYVSLASIAAAISGPVFGWVIPNQAWELIVVYGLLALFIVVKHRANIGRLMKGTEPKFDLKKKRDPEPSLDRGTDPSGAEGEPPDAT
jgi:glycerol-3-phosphate acyltransferase PlsY